jgi:acyl carrier protein
VIVKTHTPQPQPAHASGAEIRERLRGLLTREEAFHFTPELSDDASLVDAGAIDSFGMIALVIRIEEEFGVAVTPEEATADRFRSVSSIAAYIESKLNEHHRR